MRSGQPSCRLDQCHCRFRTRSRGRAPGRARPLSRRRPGPPRAALTILSCAGLAMLSGCSGRSSFLSGGPTVGQMKTSLAHLEYDNAQMKREVAKLRRENRAMEDRLVQEEQDSGELAARLDDARNLLRDRGLDPAARADAGRDGFADDPEGAGGARTLPAGQTTRKRRKPPVARISGPVHAGRPRPRRRRPGRHGPGPAAVRDERRHRCRSARPPLR